MNLSQRLLKIAAVYFMFGSVFGLVMGITKNFVEAPVHAHLNLLGWASFCLIGLLYRTHPALALTHLAKVHFWLHNLGLPVMMVGLFFVLRGESQFIPMVVVGAVSVVISIACFVANVMRVLNDDRVSDSIVYAQR
jgi:hypothetical protein